MPIEYAFPALAGLGILCLVLTALCLSARRGAFRFREAALVAEAEARRQGDRLVDRDARLAELTAELARGAEGLRRAEASRAQGQNECARLAEAVRQLEHAAAEARRIVERQAEKLEAQQAELSELHASHRALQADTDGKLSSARREVETLTSLREEMARQFKELAAATLRETGADVSQAHTAKLTELLTPFREHVGRFEEELRAVHKSADAERTRLGEQIRQLTERTEAVSTEAVNLTRALKGDKQRQGAWGEMILERILEESGLERGLHYVAQEQRRDEEGGRWRPDVVVKMPRGKCLVVDSKVSLVAYEAAVAAETEEARTRHLGEHVRAMRVHIDALAAKGYHALEDGSVDYVLMFIPIEGALSAAWQQQSDLTSYAVSKGVGLMTPTTLMVALRTVDHIWTVERRERNAEEIARRAGLLYGKVAGFVENMKAVGACLERAVSAHDKAVAQLSTGKNNVLAQVEKLKEMGARTDKALGIEFDRETECDSGQIIRISEPAE